MATLKTDFHDNPKILALPWEAIGMYAWGISYCDAQLTNGFIPATALPQIPRSRPPLMTLLRDGLWVSTRNAAGRPGYQVHDYLDHNRSREQVEAQRQADRERKAKERRNGHT